MNDAATISDPDDPVVDELCAALGALEDRLEISEAWPREQLQLCADYGVLGWFQAEEWGGRGWSDIDLLRGYLRLSAASLTTAFVLTQRSGAVQRIAASENSAAKHRWLHDLAAGRAFATVAISHLSTSRRHLASPALAAVETAGGFRLEGFSAWVTGARHADVIVVGATLPDGRQILLAVPTDLPGVECCEPQRLVGLSASHTGEVKFHGVAVERQCLIAGPIENVMKSGGGGTGGLQTSALAIGHAGAAIEFLEAEARHRHDLSEPARELRKDQTIAAADLLRIAQGVPGCSSEELRVRANSLAIRSSQAALAAAKGTGYVLGHRAGRWCREALFFLVWSCPQPVLAANLCELAGLE